MLADHAVMPTLPATDMARARAFYEGTLGMKPAPVPDAAANIAGVMYPVGSGAFLVYPSTFAGSNQATAMGFNVAGDAFDDEIANLRAAGVTFDTFDLPEGEWQDGVAVFGPMKSAWFRDSEGNILAVSTMPD
jgi:catechol 2,3-dioxygenase-like lactoylglutathione lyase family enzyme